MSLGTKVGLGPGDIVLGGGPSSPIKRGTASPLFGPCLLWPDSWMDQDALGTKEGLSLGHVVLDGESAPPNAAQLPPPIFGLCLL